MIESATRGASSERQTSPSREQKEGERRRKVSIPPAASTTAFFSSGRRERLSWRVGSEGLRGPWVLNISAKNLPHIHTHTPHTNKHHTHSTNQHTHTHTPPTYNSICCRQHILDISHQITCVIYMHGSHSRPNVRHFL